MAKIIRKIKSKKDLWAILIILVVGIASYLNLLRVGYFSMHDDIQILRLFEMQRCFTDLQIPCRWASDMGGGYGQPLFNYHPPFPYYVGMVFRLLHISLIDTAKILFIISSLLPPIFVYFLVKDFYGRIAGIVSALAFMYAPYHAVEIYVRGALTESWGVMTFGIIFLSLYYYIKDEKKKWFVFSVISLVVLFLSHNIMTILFSPFIFIWSIFWIFYFKKRRLMLPFLVIFLWSFLISSFFVVPAFFELPLIKSQFSTTQYYNFHDHFVSLDQLFLSRHFGYGPSVKGFNDDLSLQIGWPHGLIAILVTGFLIYLYFKKIKNLYLPLLLVIFFWTSVFLTLGESTFFWDLFPILSFVQFPWRVLGLIIFFNALIIGYLISCFKDKFKIIFSSVIIFTIVMLNYNYFHHQFYYPKITDREKLNASNWWSQSMASLGDYVPSQVDQLPADLAPNFPWTNDKQIVVKEFVKKSDKWSLFGENKGSNQSKLYLPIFNFPNWVIFESNKFNIAKSNNRYGVIETDISPGIFKIEGKLTNTYLRQLANMISLLSAFVLVVFTFYGNKSVRKS